MPFNVVIVGAELSGLTAPIALARDGHRAAAYERRSNTNEQSGSGVQSQLSGVNMLRRWGLLGDFAKLAHEVGAVNMIYVCGW